MAQDRLFKELCTPEIIRIGWYLAQGDSRDDFVTDPVGHSDFASNLQDRLSHLVQEVLNQRYRPRNLLEIDIPKSGLSVRPGNVLPIEEAILLHTMVYLLAPLLDKKLDRAVYSYRLHPEWEKRVKKRNSLFREVEVKVPFLKERTIRTISPFEAWYERWPAFESDAYHAYTTEGYTHLTKTDITAYFENIDLRLLEAQIRSLLKREENKTIQLLFRILESWTRSTSAGTSVGRGIPQGSNVSSFLANLYLVPLDRAMMQFCRTHDAKWFRYVDDVKVFTKSKADAREVVFIINESLRALHLNLQGSKTEVLSGDQLKKELDNSDLDNIGSAFDKVQKMGPRRRSNAKKITSALKDISPLASRFTRNLPDSVKGLPSQDNRLFRRLLTVYGLCGRTRLTKAAFAALRELPDLRILRKTLRYISQLEYNTHNEAVNALIDMVETGEVPFPYQSAIIFETLIDMHPRSPNAIAFRLRQHLIRKRHWVVVQKAIEAIMTYPYRSESAKTLAERFLKHTHPMVRRASCALLTRSPKHHVRNRIADLIYHPEPGLSRLALYYYRFITDKDFVLSELSRIKKGSTSDLAFVRNLSRFYAIAATEDTGSAEALHDLLTSRTTSSSAKVAWHTNKLIDLTKWCKTTSAGIT